MTRRTWLPLALLGAALVLLVAGRFVLLDDTSGFGSEEAVLPLGVLAAALAAAGLVLAAAHPPARRPFGAALVVLVLALTVLAGQVDGFRFVWSADEGELFLLRLLLAFLAFALVMTGERRTGEPEAPQAAGARQRAVGWVGVTLLAVVAAFFAGTDHFTATQCSGPEDPGDCDLGVLTGAVWSVVTLVALTVTAVAAETVLRRRRRRRVRA